MIFRLGEVANVQPHSRHGSDLTLMPEEEMGH